jgi:hypothetical protein
VEKMNRDIIEKHVDIQVRHIVPGRYVETYTGSLFYISKEIESKQYPTKSGTITTVRQFELLCDTCKEPKDCLASSIVMKKIRCLACAKVFKAELNNEIGIGNVIKNKYNESFLIDRFVSEERVKYNTLPKYKYRRTYEVICMKCETTGIVTNSQIWNGAVTCKQCRGIKGETNLKNITADRKLEHAAEIDKIWEEMMEMSKVGTLVQYLLDKFKLSYDDIDEPKTIENDEPIEDEYDDDKDVEIDDEINDMFDDNYYEN